MADKPGAAREDGHLAVQAILGLWSELKLTKHEDFAACPQCEAPRSDQWALTAPRR